MKKRIRSTLAVGAIALFGLVATANANLWYIEEQATEPSSSFFTSSEPMKTDGDHRLISRTTGFQNELRWHSEERAAALQSSPFDSLSEQPSLAGNQQTLSGTIAVENKARWYSEERAAAESVTLQKNDGETIELANSSRVLSLRDLDGKSVEVKGTVMERAGQRVISVNDYNIIE